MGNRYSLIRPDCLAPDEVHIWAAPLTWPANQVQQWQSLLSPDKAQRAARFYFARDREHYIVARGLLRTLLGGYLHQAPAQLEFVYNPQGKPALSTDTGTQPLHFNLSHAGDWVLYAFTCGQAVGIDVERMRADLAINQLAGQVFSATEQQMFHALPPDQQDEAFFNGWTRKEAFIKAKGQGLSLPLEQFTVEIRPGQPACLLQTHFDPAEVTRWSLYDLAVDSGYKAALAVAGQGWRLCRFGYSVLGITNVQYPIPNTQ